MTRNRLSRTDRDLGALEATLKALADGTRLRILGLVASGELCVCKIYENLGLPQPKVSRHLAYLRRARLVETRKAGRWVHYRIARSARPVVEELLASVQHCLGHLATTQADQRRLRGKTGSCDPGSAGAEPVVTCRVGEPTTTRIRQRLRAARPSRRVEIG
jgi:ArsR family transcriptional regulator